MFSQTVQVLRVEAEGPLDELIGEREGRVYEGAVQTAMKTTDP